MMENKIETEPKTVEEAIARIKFFAKEGDNINAISIQQNLISGKYGEAADDRLKEVEKIITDLSWRIMKGEFRK